MNLACIMCIKCSGIHRQLGAHITQIRSINLDLLPISTLNMIQYFGNKISNSYWEEDLDEDKINIESNMEERKQYITNKYNHKFVYKRDIEELDKLNDPTSQDIYRLVEDYIIYKDINEISNKYGTFLHYAVITKNIGLCEYNIYIFRWLMWNGSSINKPNNDNKTPLDIAKEDNNKEIIDVLTNHSNFVT